MTPRFQIKSARARAKAVRRDSMLIAPAMLGLLLLGLLLIGLQAGG